MRPHFWLVSESNAPTLHMHINLFNTKPSRNEGHRNMALRTTVGPEVINFNITTVYYVNSHVNYLSAVTRTSINTPMIAMFTRGRGVAPTLAKLLEVRECIR